MANLKTMIDPKKNRILAGLQDSDYRRIIDDLEWVPLSMDEVICEPGEAPDYIYFPVTGIISRVFTTQNGSSTELAMTGNDGFIGIALLLGGRQSPYKAVVQSKGGAYRLRAETFMWELEQSESLLFLCMAYIQALMTQIAQSVICNRHHKADQQICRWLLLTLDLLGGDQIDMTQEQIASILGVRRECVTGAAGKLQEAGLIQYSRGHIIVLDRPGIEKLVCECYGVVKSEYNRLFSLTKTPRIKNHARFNPDTLRTRAEQRLKDTQPAIPHAEWDNSRMIHELQVHQIELEMNNEELKRAYDETDALRAHYLDVYDFAPIPYITFDSQGSILEMNLAASIILGVKRSHKDRQHFSALLTDISVPIFKVFLEETLSGMMSNCEISLKSTKLHPQSSFKLEGVPDELGKECRVIMLSSQTNAAKTLLMV